ncbi:hypothetical protein CEXT_814581 [Caerostris extrusa]|uniref:Uncharacterized protein n=1 Tax=Caerostris extrusa TaxID=172846 RepID=A0AAV4MFJ8_CAEEX|nr:hypothetical protein CEXT_814581 [Caerostris extrusa]
MTGKGNLEFSRFQTPRSEERITILRTGRGTDDGGETSIFLSCCGEILNGCVGEYSGITVDQSGKDRCLSIGNTNNVHCESSLKVIWWS